MRTVLGIERPNLYAQLLKGQRVGVFTNQSGVDAELRSSVELLRSQFQLTALFVPEHGLDGAAAAGEQFADSSYGGIPVFSLYGANRRPTPAMLKTVDIVCVDIQDVGIRHYTYFSTLAYIMEECAKVRKPVLVFDRPNPLGGAVEGPLLREENRSFIGLYPIPLRHGMTIGEFARFINVEYQIGCELTVVPLLNWQRSMLWQDTGLPWVQTSPLIPTADTALLYGVTGVAGDSNLSVGVGTAKPFFFVGAPFIDSEKFTQALRQQQVAGVLFRRAAFIPRYGDYAGERCEGVEICLNEPRRLNIAELAYTIVQTAQQLYPQQLQFPERGSSLAGTKVEIAWGERSILDGEVALIAFARWRRDCAAFRAKIQPFLLYQ